MTYIIQNRIVWVLYNDRDFSYQLKRLFLPSLRNEHQKLPLPATYVGETTLERYVQKWVFKQRQTNKQTSTPQGIFANPLWMRVSEHEVFFNTSLTPQQHLHPVLGKKGRF